MIIDGLVNEIKKKDPELKFERYYFLVSSISLVFVLIIMWLFNTYNFLILCLFGWFVCTIVILIYICKVIGQSQSISMLTIKQSRLIYAEIMKRGRINNIKNFLVSNQLDDKNKVKFLIEYVREKQTPKISRDLIGYCLSIVLSLVGVKSVVEEIAKIGFVILILLISLYFFNIIRTFVNTILKKADYYSILYDALCEIYLQF